MFIVSTNLSAQDKIDRLSDKVDRMAEQIAELAKQTSELNKQMVETNKQIVETNKQIAETNKLVAVNSADIKNVDKRLDMLLYITVGGGSALFVAIIALFGFILWDRKLANAPLENKTEELKKEVDLLKQRERETKTLLKKILEKFPDLAGLA